jgi:hypothetical protein
MTVERYIRIFAGIFIMASLALGIEGQPIVCQSMGFGLHGICGRQLVSVWF